jgi:hypothetical protein
MGAGAVVRTPDGFVLRLGRDERSLLARLLGELRSLLLQPDGAAAGSLDRLFPVVHPDDSEREAEYQHLMRDELVASRLAGIAAVVEVIGTGDPPSDRRRPARGREPDVVFDEERLIAFMQAVNAVRLVLGTLLDVSEDDTIADDTGALAPEHHLYAFLSWILDSAVVALSPDQAE